jgi:hypothetical protein
VDKIDAMAWIRFGPLQPALALKGEQSNLDVAIPSSRFLIY